jgi:hypothetical protein
MDVPGSAMIRAPPARAQALSAVWQGCMCARAHRPLPTPQITIAPDRVPAPRVFPLTARATAGYTAGTMRMRSLVGVLGLAATLAGCGGLRLRLINHSVRHPSNVAVYFTVDRSNGDPVPGLTSERFHISEDGRPVSVLESRQTILNPEVAAVHYTLLLMDMSGSVTESGQVAALQQAAQAFTSRVERYQRVGIYAFDGSPTLTPIVPFTESAGSASAGVSRLGSFHPHDPSTNLHGGVEQGIHTLQQALDHATQPLKFGTLVVFTDGTDRANRVSREQMMTAVNNSTFDIFAIGVGAEIDEGELRAVGRTGTVLERNQAAVQQAFEQIAQRIEGYTQRYYLLSYCSPARAGTHMLTIEAEATNGERGNLQQEFSAAGFGPDCDPNTPPAFDTSLRHTPHAGEVGQPGH